MAKRIMRAVVGHEDVPIRTMETTGQLVVRRRDILECGHKVWTFAKPYGGARADEKDIDLSKPYDPLAARYTSSASRNCKKCLEEQDG